jgi:hypothetical protein
VEQPILARDPRAAVEPHKPQEVLLAEAIKQVRDPLLLQPEVSTWEVSAMTQRDQAVVGITEAVVQQTADITPVVVEEDHHTPRIYR